MIINFKRPIIPRSTTTALAWVSSFQLSQVILRTIINLILAKLLLPSDFGIIAIINVFSEITFSIINMGMGAAIVQKKSLDEKHFTSAYFGNFIMAFFLTLLVFLLAKPISVFYQTPELERLIKLLSVVFIVRGITTVQYSYYEKYLCFNITIGISLISLLISSVIKIVLAYNGFGVDSVILGDILFHLLISIIISVKSRYIPKISNVSFQKFKELFRFGNRIMFSDLLSILSQKFDVLIIGKLTSSKDLGFYAFAYMVSISIISSINSVLQQVFFPKFSQIQDDFNELKRVYFETIKYLSIFALPITVGIFFIAEDFVLAFYDGKWNDSILLIKLLSIYAATNALGGVLWGQILKAKGYSNYVLRLTYLRIFALFITIYFTLQYSNIYGLAWGLIIYGIFFRFLLQYFVNKILGFRMREYINAIKPSFKVAIVFFVSILIIKFIISALTTSSLLRLLLLTTAIFIVYFAVLIIFANKEVSFIFDIIRRKYMND